MVDGSNGQLDQLPDASSRVPGRWPWLTAVAIDGVVLLGGVVLLVPLPLRL